MIGACRALPAAKGCREPSQTTRGGPSLYTHRPHTDFPAKARAICPMLIRPEHRRPGQTEHGHECPHASADAGQLPRSTHVYSNTNPAKRPTKVGAPLRHLHPMMISALPRNPGTSLPINLSVVFARKPLTHDRSLLINSTMYVCPGEPCRAGNNQPRSRNAGGQWKTNWPAEIVPRPETK